MSTPEETAIATGAQGWGWAGRVAVACAAIALAAIAFGFHPVGDYFTESDFYGGYAPGARLIQHGVLDPSRYGPYGPVYDALLAVTGFVTGDLFTAARLLAVVSATAVLASTLRLGTHLAGPIAGFWLVLLLAVNPTFVRYGYSVGTDMPGFALWLASIAVLVTGKGRRTLVAGGLLAGLATLTRYNLATVVPAGVILLLLARPASQRLRAAGAFLGVFVLAIAPFTLFATMAGHPPGETLFRDAVFYLDDAPQRALETRYDAPGARVGDEPTADVKNATVVRRLLTGIPGHLRADAAELLGWPAALLVIAGILFLAVGRTTGGLLPLLPFAAVTFLSLAPVFYSTRYSMVLLPVYLAPAATAIAMATASGGWRRSVATLAVVAVLAGTVPACLELQRAVYDSLPRETLAAGQALRREAPQDARVLARKAHTAYAADREAVLMPRLTSLDALGTFCRERGIQYVYYSWYEARLRPAFGFLLDTTATVPGLVPVHATLHHPSATYRVEPTLGVEPAWWPDTAARRRIEARVNALLTDPLNAPEHYLALATDALIAGRFEDARSHAAAAAGWLPERVEPALIEGEALRQMDRTAEALTVFDEALQRHPQHTALQIGRGAALRDLGRDEDAARQWRPLIEQVRDGGMLREMHALFTALGDTTSANLAMRTWQRVRGG